MLKTGYAYWCGTQSVKVSCTVLDRLHAGNAIIPANSHDVQVADSLHAGKGERH